MRGLVLLQLAPWDELNSRLQALWTGIERGALDLVVAVIVLVVAWAIARLLAWVALVVLRRARFNQGMRGLLGPAMGVHEPAGIASWLLYWLVLTRGGLLPRDW